MALNSQWSIYLCLRVLGLKTRDTMPDFPFTFLRQGLTKSSGLILASVLSWGRPRPYYPSTSAFPRAIISGLVRLLQLIYDAPPSTEFAMTGSCKTQLEETLSNPAERSSQAKMEDPSAIYPAVTCATLKLTPYGHLRALGMLRW